MDHPFFAPDNIRAIRDSIVARGSPFEPDDIRDAMLKVARTRKVDMMDEHLDELNAAVLRDVLRKRHPDARYMDALLKDDGVGDIPGAAFRPDGNTGITAFAPPEEREVRPPALANSRFR